ncbi:UDP-GlcNAc:betaGal beta-1,3-N-acetylglucosaminyltransferase 7-like [Petromyzon marinus]|uniref:Hexosyltransferase n=1 Tax=Petromyzon marinus TaxID=7757 RepID=A0AAJ7TV34_PETMA|nr:UDP-GlcNAc:betaGal beta-1,3-N-acetylglucosaminyltransferase 7-like [Petromyzon marinus]
MYVFQLLHPIWWAVELSSMCFIPDSTYELLQAISKSNVYGRYKSVAEALYLCEELVEMLAMLSGCWPVHRKVQSCHMGNHCCPLAMSVPRIKKQGQCTHKDWGIIQSDCMANHDLIDTDWFKSVGDHFKDFILYRDCHYFPMVHNHPEKLESFEDATLNLLLVVKSLAENSERREAVRSTWGHERDVRLRTRTGSEIARVRTLFLLGLPLPSLVHTQKSVDLEDSVQQDILQWEFFDNFYNLTLKDMNFLRWISIYSSSVAYVLKGDDMFVNMDNILEYLLAAPQDGGSPLLLGSVVTDSYVVRDAGSKYFIPTVMFDGYMYPHFVSWGSYVMSREVLRRLQAVSGDVQKFPLDDVWLEMCLHRANVSLTSHQGFRTLGVPQLKSADMQVCLYRDVMSVHRFLPTQLLNMWKMFTDPTIKCTRLH